MRPETDMDEINWKRSCRIQDSQMWCWNTCPRKNCLEKPNFSSTVSTCWCKLFLMMVMSFIWLKLGCRDIISWIKCINYSVYHSNISIILIRIITICCIIQFMFTTWLTLLFWLFKENYKVLRIIWMVSIK